MTKTTSATMIALAVAALSGCVTMPQPPEVQLTATFDENMAREALRPGTNTVNGNAFLRQRGGGVVTCAGADVVLIPATNYARQRMSSLYGFTDAGVRTVSQGGVKFNPDLPAYVTNMAHTRCDSQGKFTFANVADGDFFVSTQVVWSVGQYSREGGALMHRFSVNNGQTVNLILGQ